MTDAITWQGGAVLVTGEAGIGKTSLNRLTLTSSGLDHQDVRHRSAQREPEAIAFTAPVGATGLFELEPQGGRGSPMSDPGSRSRHDPGRDHSGVAMTVGAVN